MVFLPKVTLNLQSCPGLLRRRVSSSHQPPSFQTRAASPFDENVLRLVETGFAPAAPSVSTGEQVFSRIQRFSKLQRDPVKGNVRRVPLNPVFSTRLRAPQGRWFLHPAAAFNDLRKKKCELSPVTPDDWIKNILYLLVFAGRLMSTLTVSVSSVVMVM